MKPYKHHTKGERQQSRPLTYADLSKQIEILYKKIQMTKTPRVWLYYVLGWKIRLAKKNKYSHWLKYPQRQAARRRYRLLHEVEA